MGAGHCPWGRYTDRIACNIGKLAAAGEVATHIRKEARKYIRIATEKNIHI